MLAAQRVGGTLSHISDLVFVVLLVCFATSQTAESVFVVLVAFDREILAVPWPSLT